jgi:hypothetical protein
MTQWTRGLSALAVVAVLAGSAALARGLDMNLQLFGVTPGMNVPSANYAPRDYYTPPETQVRSYDDTTERRKPKRATVASFGSGKPVCVRLCDGSFFPTASATGGDSACAAQCPDAPTALYTMPTDRIEDAVSSTGKLYSALPVAKRFETSFESTCTCHRSDTVASRAKELLHDNTLRKGDVVMTAEGFRVYEGDGYGPTGPKDFVSLARARVSKEERATLTAMERAGGGSPAPARPSLVAARPKGNVTVDNGTGTTD